MTPVATVAVSAGVMTEALAWAVRRLTWVVVVAEAWATRSWSVVVVRALALAFRR
ncbi:hypothetical protein D3C85_1619310 [compost metagenome]